MCSILPGTAAASPAGSSDTSEKISARRRAVRPMLAAAPARVVTAAKERLRTLAVMAHETFLPPTCRRSPPRRQPPSRAWSPKVGGRLARPDSWLAFSAGLPAPPRPASGWAGMPPSACCRACPSQPCWHKRSTGRPLAVPSRKAFFVLGSSDGSVTNLGVAILSGHATWSRIGSAGKPFGWSRGSGGGTASRGPAFGGPKSISRAVASRPPSDPKVASTAAGS